MDEISNKAEEQLQSEIAQIQAIKDLSDNEILDLLLIKLGFKRASEILFVMKTEVLPDHNFDTEESIERTKAKLEGLGFLCAWNKNPNIPAYARELSIAIDGEALKVNQSNVFDDDMNFGAIYGYPQTAIDAFASQDEDLLISYGDIETVIPEEIREAEWFPLVHFRLSKAHWREELETPKRWYKALKKYAPDFLKEYFKKKKADAEFLRTQIGERVGRVLEE